MSKLCGDCLKIFRNIYSPTYTMVENYCENCKQGLFLNFFKNKFFLRILQLLENVVICSDSPTKKASLPPLEILIWVPTK